MSYVSTDSIRGCHLLSPDMTFIVSYGPIGSFMWCYHKAALQYVVVLGIGTDIASWYPVVSERVKG